MTAIDPVREERGRIATTLVRLMLGWKALPVYKDLPVAPVHVVSEKGSSLRARIVDEAEEAVRNDPLLSKMAAAIRILQEDGEVRCVRIDLPTRMKLKRAMRDLGLSVQMLWEASSGATVIRRRRRPPKKLEP